MTTNVKCPRCGKCWTYSGNNKFTCVCPDCKKVVKIAENAIFEANVSPAISDKENGIWHRETTIDFPSKMVNK